VSKKGIRSMLIKERNKFLSVLLLGFSAVCGLIIFIKVGGFLVTSARADELVKKAIAQSKSDPNEAAKYFAKYKELADQLKKKNLFVMEKPRRHPGEQVTGILGHEVLIGGKWYKAGDKVEDAEILAIEPTQVKFRWNGEEKYFSPIGAKSAPGPQKKPEQPIAVKADDKKPEAAKPVEMQAKAPAAEEDPLAWMGVKLSAKVREKMLETWNKLSDEQKEKMKEQWNNMSSEQKQQAADAWEQHL